MVKKLFFVLILAMAGMAGANAQVRIGGGEAPDKSAVLDLNPDNDTSSGNATLGLALPRVRLKSTANPYPLLSHVKGMTVYNIAAEGNVTPGVYTANGSLWVRQADRETLENLVTNIYNTVFGDTIINYITQHIQTTELGDSIAYYITQHFEATALGDTVMQYITQNLDSSALMDSVANYISTNNEYLTQLIDNIARNIYTTVLGDTIVSYITEHIGTTALGDSIVTLVHENELDGIIGNEVSGATANGGLVRSGLGTAASPYTLGISSGGVTNSHLANGAVTAEKISDNAVTSSKIADGAITNADINASAAIALNKIALPDASTNNGKVLKSNGTAWVAGDDSNTDTNTTYTADNGLTLSGTTFSIGAGQVNGTMIADGAVATAKLADKSITVAKVNATGTASSTTYLRGDGSWSAPAGDGQGVTSVSGTNGITVTNSTTTPVISLPAGTMSGNVLKWNGTVWASAADAGITGEQDGIIGNEVTTATTGGGLTRSGSGTVASPYTLGISSGGVTSSHLADNAVTSAKIVDGAITNADISASAGIAGSKLADKSVTVAKVNAAGTASSTTWLRGDGTWSAGDGQGVTSVSGANGITVANGTTTPVISLPAGTTNGNVLKWDGTAWASAADAGITTETDGIVGNEVTNATGSGGLTRSGSGTAASPYTLGISSGGVTTSHLADNSVTSVKIAEGAITNADINVLAAISLNKIALPDALTNSGKVLKSNGKSWIADDDSNTDTNTTYSAGNGLTISGTTFSIGTGQVNGTMIADGTITNADISASAGIAGSKLADKSVTVAKVNAAGTASSTTYLRGDGTWSAGDGQGVTSVSGVNGITVTNGTTTPTVGLPAGTAGGNVLKWNGTAWASAADAGITGEQDGIVGNEVTNATGSGGLTRSGSGTAASPYTLGIASGGVTSSHLADNAVTSAKIVDGAISNADINSSAGITLNKLSSVNTTVGNSGAAQGAVMTWDTGGWQPKMPASGGVTQVTGSGAVTVTNTTTTPVVSIGTGAINSAHIADKSINAGDLNSMGAAEGNVLTYTGTSWLPKPLNLAGAVVYLGTNDEDYGLIPAGTYSAGQIHPIFINVVVPAGYAYYIFVPYSTANVMFPAFATTFGSGIHSRHIIFTKSSSYSSFNVKYLIFGVK
jgi:hypothetical protein